MGCVAPGTAGVPAVVVAAISPYAEARRRARETTEAYAPFIEVYVRASVDECTRRDPRVSTGGHWPESCQTSPACGSLAEEPVAPDLELDTELKEAQACADQVIAFLASRGLLR